VRRHKEFAYGCECGNRLCKGRVEIEKSDYLAKRGPHFRRRRLIAPDCRSRTQVGGTEA